jgi:hypothetical protein
MLNRPPRRFSLSERTEVLAPGQPYRHAKGRGRADDPTTAAARADRGHPRSALRATPDRAEHAPPLWDPRGSGEHDGHRGRADHAVGLACGLRVCNGRYG